MAHLQELVWASKNWEQFCETRAAYRENEIMVMLLPQLREQLDEFEKEKEYEMGNG